MLLPKRHESDESYRYGFQNQEKDDELKGEGNSINYKYRMHDPRIGRFFATDPLTSKYPHYSPYQFSGNKVIHKVELEGLEEGSLSLANYLLGRPFSIKGKIILGRGIGKKLGYPTANIDYLPYYLPKSGVYFTRINYQDKIYYGITNVGNKPTYIDLDTSVETHIFGIDEDLYNKEMKLEFIEFIRPEIKFNSEYELSKQIYKDIEKVKIIIKEANNA